MSKHGKPVKMKCPFCSKMFNILKYNMHMNTCKGRNKPKTNSNGT